MTCQEFCEAISFHSWMRTLSALGRVRIQRKLAPTAENELFLKTLAFEIEVSQRIAKANKRDKSGKATKAILPVSSSGKVENEDIRVCARHLWIHGPIVLDAIYMLLQDLHEARQNLPNPEHTQIYA